MCVCRLVLFSPFVFIEASRTELDFHDGSTQETNLILHLKLYMFYG